MISLKLWFLNWIQDVTAKLRQTSKRTKRRIQTCLYKSRIRFFLLTFRSFYSPNVNVKNSLSLTATNPKCYFLILLITQFQRKQMTSKDGKIFDTIVLIGVGVNGLTAIYLLLMYFNII